MSEEYKAFRQAAEVNWLYKETIDNLMEATHYFAELQRGRDYTKMDFSLGIQGSKGRICNIVDIKFDLLTGLQTVISETYRYYVLYNREYFNPRPMRYERVSESKQGGKWQTVHKKVIDEAALYNLTGRLMDHCCIVIIMQNKTAWYIHPNKMKEFCFAYETEDIPWKELEPEGHIPVTRDKIISQKDPFIK